MIYLPTLMSIIEVLLVTIPVLLTVAYVTVAERKTMASMQRRLGPNIVAIQYNLAGASQAGGDLYYGLLQAFADALKLLLKEYVSPTQANLGLFFSGPIITLIFSLLGLALSDINIGILYMLAVSSLSTYGSLRSTAQLISYELILSSAILLVVMLTGSLNITSELVSGFMTEHAAVIFVFFFLAEYASIVLICILTCILFLGDYYLDNYNQIIILDPLLEG
ncbi:NADH-ubiquinone oxidoreductase chain 1 [Golovinomyces cichoracearum]|uniref:NADH-ubiquinone oxidoreductase chain 1 n=1 Tax=Golovinomyces cichoracearum TaxID=62708 RepID=A0A420HL90_9PEZI|nr:NADH-ubiquinone oxidoreductase chain 1 [Golovinomyces cichoracearum]